MQSRCLTLASAAALVACTVPPPPVDRVAAETPAILQSVIKQGWQEGPGGGRICLDARILPDSGVAAGVPVFWGTTVLDAVQSDTLVAIDTAAAGSSAPGTRSCVARVVRTKIRFGQPSVRADTALLAYTTLSPATTGVAESRNEGHVKLARLAGSWRIVGYPDMTFPQLPAAP